MDDRERRLREVLNAKLLARVQKAQTDPIEFIRLVGRVEGGRRAQIYRVHEEWQGLFTTARRLVIFAPYNHGKSTQLRWRLLWELMRNPNLRILYVSSTKELPQKVLRALKTDIEENAALRAVAPRLRPGRGAQRMWQEDAIIIDRDDNLPDPTIQITGAPGHILGARIDLIVFDDLHDYRNTLTSESRNKILAWVQREVFTRIADRGTRIWFIGNTFHSEDVPNRMGQLPTYTMRRYSALVRDADGKESALIPELFTVEDVKNMATDLGPHTARLMLFNELASEEESRFKLSWFEQCLARGRGLPLARSWNPLNSPTFTGIDLGVSRDLTVLFTITILPDGSRRILDIQSGNWRGPEIVERIVDVHYRYGSTIAVESNAAQEYLREFAQALSGVQIDQHFTGMNKHDPRFGVESIATELARGQWIIPCDDDLNPEPEVLAWIKEVRAYNRRDHMGDRAAASWICRECARRNYTYAVDPALDLNIDLLVR